MQTSYYNTAIIRMSSKELNIEMNRNNHVSSSSSSKKVIKVIKSMKKVRNVSYEIEAEPVIDPVTVVDSIEAGDDNNNNNNNDNDNDNDNNNNDISESTKKLLRSLKGLTDYDLDALFKRLDTSGDGRISRDELKNLSTIFTDKLPYGLEDRFNDHDHDKDDHLDKDEFVGLMKKLVATHHSIVQDERNTKDLKKDFITAVRYGWEWKIDKNNNNERKKEFIFHLYHGIISTHEQIEEITENGEKKERKSIVKFILNNGDLLKMNDDSFWNYDSHDSPIRGIDINVSNGLTESDRGMVGELNAEKVTIDELNKMMIRDDKLNNELELSKSNSTNLSKKVNRKQQIYYWVDVAMGSTDNIMDYLTDFSLSNQPEKFKKNFKAGNMEIIEKKTDENRYHRHEDHRQKVDYKLQASYCLHSKTSSLSILLPSMSLKNRPIAYNLPIFFDENCKSQILDSVIKYYLKRISFFFPTSKSNLKQAIEHEEYERIKSASDLSSQVLNGISADKGLNFTGRRSFYSSSFQGEIDAKLGILGKDEMLKRLASPVISTPKRLRKNHPTWLVSERDWSKLRLSPYVETQSLSLSLISTVEHGIPVGVITLRLYEDEEFKDHSKPKKKEVKDADPLTIENYEYLSTLSRTGPIGRLLSCARTKLLELTDSAAAAQSYQTISTFAKIVDHPFALATYLIAFIHAYNCETLRSDGPIDKWLEFLELEMEESIISKHQSHIFESKKILKKIGKYIHTSLSMFDSLYESANSEPDEGKEKDKDMENLNLIPDITEEYAIISSFFGNEKREKCRYLRDIIDGTSGFNSGLLYLKDRCDTLLEQIQELQEDVKYTLEERRNFYSFLLTAITIGIAPITILTGYFGMNFENMTELHPETFPSTPGVELLWVILIVFYGLLFVISVHSGLFYKLFC